MHERRFRHHCYCLSPRLVENRISTRMVVAKELKNDGKAFLGPVFESMIEQAGIVDDAEEVGLMVHIRLRPKANDDRWYQIDFVMQDESMAYYSNFDGRLPAEMVHVVPLSGGLPRQMFIAVEALDEVAMRTLSMQNCSKAMTKWVCHKTKHPCVISDWKLRFQQNQPMKTAKSTLLSERLRIVLNRFLCLAQPAERLVGNSGH